jgi:hypothetical protein
MRQQVMRPPSSRVIYGDRVASLLAEGVCGYDKSRLYCACAKHVDVANAGKANTSDTNGTSSQFHIAFISLPLRKKGCVHNGRPGYINAATSRKGYYPMSAFGGKADINGRQSDVCFWPKADMSGSRLLLCKLTSKPHFVGRKSLL